MRKRHQWGEKDRILTLDFYFKYYPKPLSGNRSEIEKLTEKINALPDNRNNYPLSYGSVRMKLGNYRALDNPDRNTGLSHASKADQATWKKYVNHRERLKRDAQSLLAKS